MISKVLSSVILGVDAHPVEVEVDCSLGLPKWNTVGLPENTVKEGRDRVIAAIRNSGYDFTNQKITINLAPANIKKGGTALDLPIAIGLLISSGLIPQEKTRGILFAGELSLHGELKPIQGALPIAIFCKRSNHNMILPKENLSEVSALKGAKVAPFSTLTEIVETLLSTNPVNFQEGSFVLPREEDHETDFSEIKGQDHAKRGIEIAAAGGHNVIMVGPPGSGKTMLARRIPTILPSPSFDEIIETSKIYSVMGMLSVDAPLLTSRPFRSPHHTISDTALIGGGAIPRPGEASLAHNGVLFLDELLEFNRRALDVLRQPIEDKKITISRAAATLTFPTRFMLIAATNPCPCGYFGCDDQQCTCTPQLIRKYRTKLSGPLLDRIDIHLEVPRLPFKKLSDDSSAVTSKMIRKRIVAARKIQEGRFKKPRTNSMMNTKEIRAFCSTSPEGKRLLENAAEKLKLSARAYHKILKVARTIADLEGEDNILLNHISEAVQYRGLDRRIL